MHCSFCGKSRQEITRLVEGHSGVLICNECIELCADIIGMRLVAMKEDTVTVQVTGSENPDVCITHTLPLKMLKIVVSKSATPGQVAQAAARAFENLIWGKP